MAQGQKEIKLIVLLGAISLIESFSYAIVLPLIPFVAEQYGMNEIMIGSIFASFSLCQLLSAPLIGLLSDKKGRKPLLLFSQVGTAAGFLMLALARSPTLILLSRLVDGMSAGNVSLLYSIVCDRFAVKERTKYFAFLSTCTGVGILFGPLTGSLLGGRNLSFPSYFAMFLSFGTIVATLIFFRESGNFNRGHQQETEEGKEKNTPIGEYTIEVKSPDQHSAGQKSNFPLSNILTTLKVKQTRKMLVIILVNNIIFNTFLLSFPVFAQQTLGYTVKDVGILITLLLFLAALFQVLVLPILLRRLPDSRSALSGFLLYLTGFCVLFFAGNVLLLIVAGTLVLWGVVILNPVLSSALSKQAGEMEEGKMMGINQAVASVGQIIGPLIGYSALFIASTTGFTFLCLSITVGGLVLLRRITI